MRLTLLLLSSVSVLAAALGACGGNVSVSGSAGSGTGAGTSSGSTMTTSGSSGSSGTGGSGVSPAGCPSSQPTQGTSCTHEGATCTYGDSVWPSCHEAFTCQGGAWNASTASCPPNDAACPSSAPADMSPCNEAGTNGSQCGYPTGQICQCAPCPPKGPVCMPMPVSHWYCDGPPTTSGCPTLIPNEGSACSQAGLLCDYPSLGCGETVTCTNGAWTWQANPCPG